MKEAIQKAIEGGYDVEAGYRQEKTVGDRDRFALLDPLFWRALGKAENWKKKMVIRRGTVIGNYCTPKNECFEEMGFKMDYLDPWLFHWHNFIDHLAARKDIDSFFNELLTQ